jgi:hypothetical protein
VCKHFHYTRETFSAALHAFCSVIFGLRGGAETSSRALFAQTSAFALGGSTPDAELFLVIERVLETLRFHFALRANRSRRLGRSSSFRKEDLWVNFGAARLCLPLDRLKDLVRDPLHPPAFLSPPTVAALGFLPE